MKNVLRALLIGVASVVGLALAAVFFVLPQRFDKVNNAVADYEAPASSAQAEALHDTLRVADLHADTLLWARDLRHRQSRGHVDLPRLRDGRVALQVFTAVTKSPSGQNYEQNTSDSDRITLLAMVQRWPAETWESLEARAAHQASRLHEAARKDAFFDVVTRRDELQVMLEKNAADPRYLGGILGLEGAHAFEGSLDAIDRLYAAGYRVVGLHHFFDNQLGGSLHGISQEGLTPFGREAVEHMLALGMIIDVAHSSEAVVADVLDMTDAPVIISHTGIKSLCDSPRNISDALMARIAEGGGLIGIGFWNAAVCDATPDGIARTVARAVELFGEDAIALGSDFDGTVTTYFDASDLSLVTAALLRADVSPRVIKKVMGENQINFFLQHLPSDEGTPAE